MVYFAQILPVGRPRRVRKGLFSAMANKRTILIVDDDAELREALVEQLALHEEFDAVSADSGTKGVQAAKNGQVDLVIMDVGLPDVDGRAVSYTHLRAH